MTAIVGTLTPTIRNGDSEDAAVLMSLFAFIQAQVNANACPATAGSAVLKGNGAGGTTGAAAGTDYLKPEPGMVFDYAGGTVPNGYLLCDGSAVSRTTYSALFTAISTTWGVGDGSTTFNLPPAAGRTSVAAGTGSGLTARTLGQTFGEETHVLTTAELAAHNHVVNISDPTHGHTGAVAAHGHEPLVSDSAGGLKAGGDPAANGLAASAGTTSGYLNNPGGLGTAFSQSVAPAVTINVNGTGITASSNNAGGGGAHNNIQPSIVFNKIIKT